MNTLSEPSTRKRPPLHWSMPQLAPAVLRLWTCVDHDTHWPVGGASIVLAPDEDAARELLTAVLRENGLWRDSGPKKSRPFTLQEVDLHAAGAKILCEGEH